MNRDYRKEIEVNAMSLLLSLEILDKDVYDYWNDGETDWLCVIYGAANLELKKQYKNKPYIGGGDK